MSRKKQNGPSRWVKNLLPRTDKQADYIEALCQFPVVIAEGAAGSGKTLLAVYRATREIEDDNIDRIILVRPIVATEDLGYLPGGIEDKVDPYMRPLFDALYSRWGPAVVSKKMELNEIEIAPLAYMRGRTLNNCFIILDEAQNTTIDQMRMFLTRLGDNVKVAITGDITQYDLGKYNGLTWAISKLKDCPSVACIKFEIKDVVRSDLSKQILEYIDE
jgi:phosphate starvation-inducible PhoH-like protein